MHTFRLASRSADLLRALAVNRRGATAVEAAFTLPLVILLSLGAVELGRIVWAQASINHAVKETARFASVHGAASGPAAATANELQSMALEMAELPADTLVPAVSWSPDNFPGGVVTVQLHHTFSPLVSPFAPNSFTFSSTASMTIVR
jgi:Flp pilus assembly protein TadG